MCHWDVIPSSNKKIRNHIFLIDTHCEVLQFQNWFCIAFLRKMIGIHGCYKKISFRKCNVDMKHANRCTNENFMKKQQSMTLHIMCMNRCERYATFLINCFVDFTWWNPQHILFTTALWIPHSWISIFNFMNSRFWSVNVFDIHSRFLKRKSTCAAKLCKFHACIYNLSISCICK